MIEAVQSDRELVVDILVQSFWDNKSVNYIVRQDSRKRRRLRCLISYAFSVCHAFGKVYLSEDREAAALLLLPARKRTTLRTLLWDLGLVLRCTGVGNLPRVLARERKIGALHPKEPFWYLWFIGVAPGAQGKGRGSALLQAIIAEATAAGMPVYLETSREENLGWYKRFGFVRYHRLYFDYVLHCLKLPVGKQGDETR